MKKIFIIIVSLLLMSFTLTAAPHTYTMQEILNMVYGDGSLGIHEYTGQEVLNLVYSSSDTALSVVLSEIDSIKFTGEIVQTPTADDKQIEDGTIDVTGHSYIRVTADSAVMLDTAPSVEDGTADGQRIIIQGTNDTNTVQIVDNTNCQLAGGVDITLGKGDILELIWDSGDGDWYEISRSDN